MSGLALGITGAVVGGAQFFKGLSDKKKDQKQLESLTQPFYKIQDEFKENRNIAAGQAGQGLPTDTRNYLTEQSEKGLGSSLGALSAAGGGVNDVSRLLEGYNSSLRATGAEDAETHSKNLQYFMKANSDIAGQKTTQWSVNEYQPFEAKLKELKQNVAADQANEWQGITTAAGGLTAGITGNSNASLMKKLFSKPTAEGGSQVQDPYAPGSGYQPPVLAQTGGAAGSPAGGIGPYIDPNRIPQGVQTSPVYPGNPI